MARVPGLASCVASLRWVLSPSLPSTLDYAYNRLSMFGVLSSSVHYSPGTLTATQGLRYAPSLVGVLALYVLWSPLSSGLRYAPAAPPSRALSALFGVILAPPSFSSPLVLSPSLSLRCDAGSRDGPVERIPSQRYDSWTGPATLSVAHFASASWGGKKKIWVLEQNLDPGPKSASGIQIWVLDPN